MLMLNTGQKYLVIILLLPIILACGLPGRLFNNTNRNGEQILATEVANINEGSRLIAGAYDKLQTLPGYRLENSRVVRDIAGNRTSQVIISEYDAVGNVHTVSQNSDGRQNEIYIVGGQTYIFDIKQNGWVNLSLITPAEVQQIRQNFEPDIELNPAQLLTQLVAVPVKEIQANIKNRLTTRYKLKYIMTEINGLFNGEQNDMPIPLLDLQGTLWIDNDTGALLKSEIFLYKEQVDQPAWEFLTEISDIGNIPPITMPAPMVATDSIVSATATAQAWSALQAKIDYQNQIITFEIIPLRVKQTPNSSPLTAELKVILRQLPDSISRKEEIEPFLAQLRHQLSLSIPSRNLIVTSSGFQLESSDIKNSTLNVINVTYFFKVDLEKFSHIELIISGQGNPVFAPVPIE